MIYKVRRLIEYHATGGVQERFQIGDEAEEVPFNHLTSVEQRILRGQEEKARSKDPNARVIPAKLGGKLRWLILGDHVEPAAQTAQAAKPPKRV